MPTAKDEVRRILAQLPDEVTLEEIQYHIYVRQKVELGLEDTADGRVVSQEDAEKRMSKWLDD